MRSRGERPQEERERQAKNLVALKSDAEAVANRIKADNHKRRLRAEELARRRAEEKGDILAAGANPYAVWRKEDLLRAREAAREDRLNAVRACPRWFLARVLCVCARAMVGGCFCGWGGA